jgi:hypothetical protein
MPPARELFTDMIGAFLGLFNRALTVTTFKSTMRMEARTEMAGSGFGDPIS